MFCHRDAEAQSPSLVDLVRTPTAELCVSVPLWQKPDWDETYFPTADSTISAESSSGRITGSFLPGSQTWLKGTAERP